MAGPDAPRVHLDPMTPLGLLERTLARAPRALQCPKTIQKFRLREKEWAGRLKRIQG